MDVHAEVGKGTKVTYFEHRPSRSALILDVSDRVAELVTVGLQHPESGNDSRGEVVLEGGDLRVVVDGVELSHQRALSLVLAGMRYRLT